MRVPASVIFVPTPKLYRLRTGRRVTFIVKVRDLLGVIGPTQVKDYETHGPDTFESDTCLDAGRTEQLLGEDPDKKNTSDRHPWSTYVTQMGKEKLDPSKRKLQ
jgi:hypothetical protein